MTIHLRKLFVLLLAAALLLAACGDDDDEGGAGVDTDTTDTTEAAINATLNGSGSTFQAGFDEEAITAYKEVQPGVTVNYGGGGSGKGRQDLMDQLVDFAGTDGLVKPEDVAKFKGGEFLYFPTVAAPITVSYHLTGVDELRLSAGTLAKIFQRQIKTWDDAAIKAENPDADLPSTDITVAHRSDGSGTTEQFTKFLAAAAGSEWTLGSGSTVNWPADTQAGNGNPGVAQIVKATLGAVGYVDLSDAKATGLQYAWVKNKAGKFIEPTLEAASAALEGTTINADLTYNPMYAPGEDAYPITSPTWILVYKNQTDANKGKALKSFLNFILSDGQDLANDVDYATLPDTLIEKARAQLDNLVIP